MEVYRNGIWGAVCDVWDLDNAQVVCRQLGFDHANDVRNQLYYGWSSGVFYSDDVNCVGNELTIEDCSHEVRMGVLLCFLFGYVAVQCSVSSGNSFLYYVCIITMICT